MKQITLTQNKVALVDDEDYEYLIQWKWCADKGHNTWYAVRNNFINKVKFKIYMHRVILQNATEVDHEDGNGLNNQRYNIRDSTRIQNSYNQNKRVDNTSNYKGVILKIDKFRTKPWLARIFVNKQQICLGYYATAVEAAMAYDQAAKELHGKFARLNFPNGIK
jgi:hypothetical protein